MQRAVGVALTLMCLSGVAGTHTRGPCQQYVNKRSAQLTIPGATIRSLPAAKYSRYEPEMAGFEALKEAYQQYVRAAPALNKYPASATAMEQDRGAVAKAFSENQWGTSPALVTPTLTQDVVGYETAPEPAATRAAAHARHYTTFPATRARNHNASPEHIFTMRARTRSLIHASARLELTPSWHVNLRSFDEVLLPFVHANGTIIMVRAGDLIAGKIPGKQWFAPHLHENYELYKGLVEVLVGDEAELIRDINTSIVPYPCTTAGAHDPYPMHDWLVKYFQRHVLHNLVWCPDKKYGSASIDARAAALFYTALQVIRVIPETCSQISYSKALSCLLRARPHIITRIDALRREKLTERVIHGQTTNNMLGIPQVSPTVINQATLSRPIKMTPALGAQFPSFWANTKPSSKVRQISNSVRDPAGILKATSKPTGTQKVFMAVQSHSVPVPTPLVTAEDQAALGAFVGDNAGPPRRSRRCFWTCQQGWLRSTPWLPRQCPQGTLSLNPRVRCGTPWSRASRH